MELVSIPLDQITVGPRLREVDPDWVALIAASMAERGQDTPVQVRAIPGGWTLVAGAHRMAALREAGIPNALATVVVASDDEARLIEIDENLMRRELSELDRAAFLAERKALYERLNPTTKHGGKRSKGQVDMDGHLTLPPRFTAETAERIGLSERQIRRIIARAQIWQRQPDGVGDGLRIALSRSRWANHGPTLDALAKLSPAKRRQAVTLLTRDEDPAPNLAAALREMGEGVAERSTADDWLARLLTTWRKSPADARRAFLRALAHSGDGPLLVEAVEQQAEAEAAAQRRVLRAVAGGGA